MKDEYDGYEGDHSFIAPSSPSVNENRRSMVNANPVQSCCFSFGDMIKGLFKKKKKKPDYTEITEMT